MKTNLANVIDTARVEDINGWVEVRDNPLSKVGIFEYSGAQISPDLDPDKMYRVYRPEEELADPETIESFRLLPWVDEHEMLGRAATPAEKKGVSGVVGENVRFEFPYLLANIKIFSEKLAQLIKTGKKELSIGYRCLYDIVSGVYNGQPYDVVQRNIRGNHLALVTEGRAGPDVAVLDHFKIMLDNKEFYKMNPNEKKVAGTVDSPTIESVAAEVAEMKKILTDFLAGMTKEPALDKDESGEEASKEKVLDEETLDEDTTEKEGEQKKPGAKDEKCDSGENAMDAKYNRLAQEVTALKKEKSVNMKDLFAEVAKRDALVKQLVPEVGVFDHAEKTLDEVAAYGIKKLGLTARKGEELAVLSGYLFAARKASVANAGVNSVNTGMDSVISDSDRSPLIDALATEK